MNIRTGNAFFHFKSFQGTLLGLLLLTALLHTCTSGFSQERVRVDTLPGKTPVGFETEINAFLRQDAISFPPAGAWLFTGSSTIRKWEQLSTDFSGIRLVHRGFGGSTMEALNYYLRYIVLPYKPSKIVVYEGDNDLAAGATPEEFIARCDSFISTVHRALPQTKIWFISIKPSPSRRQKLAVQEQTNRMLKKLARQRVNTGFIDITRLMYDRNGKLIGGYFEADSLHVTARCYQVWAGYMKKKLGIH